MYARTTTMIFGSVLAIALSGCLENAGVAVKGASLLSTSQTNCLVPGAESVRTASRSLAASSVRVGPDFCSKPSAYDCVSHRFGPSVEMQTDQAEP